MATQVKHRRGTAAEIAAGTPAIGELWFNTTDNTIHMGDGVTQGGIKQTFSSVNVKNFGAKADGLADDIAAIKAARDFAISVGLPLEMTGRFRITEPYQHYGVDIVGRPTFVYDLRAGYSGPLNKARPLQFSPLNPDVVGFTGSATRGQTGFTLESAPGWSVGDRVVLSAGTNISDSNEAQYIYYASIVSINGASLRLSVPIPGEVNDPTSSYNTVTKYEEDFSVLNIPDIALEVTSGTWSNVSVIQAFYINRTDRSKFGFLSINNVLQNSNGILLVENDNPYIAGIEVVENGGSTGSDSRIVDGWTNRNAYIGQVKGRCFRVAVFHESGGELTIGELFINHGGNGAAGDAGLFVIGQSKVRVKKYTYNNNGSTEQWPARAFDDSTVIIDELNVVGEYGNIDLGLVERAVTSNIHDDPFQTDKRFVPIQGHDRFTTTANVTNDVFNLIPKGFLGTLKIYVSDLTGITAFTAAPGTDPTPPGYAAPRDCLPLLSSDEFVKMPWGGYSGIDNSWNREYTSKSLRVTTDATGGGKEIVVSWTGFIIQDVES